MKSIGQSVMLAVEMGMFFSVLIFLHQAGLIAF